MNHPKPIPIPTEESFTELLLDLTSCMGTKDDILAVYILNTTPLGKELIKRAKALYPEHFRTTDEINAFEVIEILEAEEHITNLIAHERYGNDAKVYYWQLRDKEDYGYPAGYEFMIGIAKQWERSARYTKQERHRIRTVRKALERESDLEKYVERKERWEAENKK